VHTPQEAADRRPLDRSAHAGVPVDTRTRIAKAGQEREAGEGGREPRDRLPERNVSEAPLVWQWAHHDSILHILIYAGSRISDKRKVKLRGVVNAAAAATIKRKQYRPKFKAQAALEAIRGEPALSRWASAGARAIWLTA
jgi:hypothetical protein